MDEGYKELAAAIVERAVWDYRNALKYKNNPGFMSFKEVSKLDFKPYSEFKNQSITERTNLYRGILLYNWK